MRTKGILVVLIAFLAISADRIQAQSPVDSDRDGINDELEQNLLMKFRPSFLVSSDDCDRVPAEFTPFIATPTVEKKNGTIYGQVRRGSSDIQRDGVFLEVHYYHLWAHDCGQMGHPLDAEHVSALVHAPEMDSPISEWTAQYWYAAAHQDTICDSSTMTMATTLSATASGPTVWISDGQVVRLHAKPLPP